MFLFLYSCVFILISDCFIKPAFLFVSLEIIYFTFFFFIVAIDITL